MMYNEDQQQMPVGQAHDGSMVDASMSLPEDYLNMTGGGVQPRPKSHYAKRHNIVQKDCYRVMHADRTINKSL
jgi:hypothetical protein